MRHLAGTALALVSSIITLTNCGESEPFDPFAGKQAVQITVRGTVTWDDGASVPGAAVLVEEFVCNYLSPCTWDTGGTWRVWAQTKTDGAGAYTIVWTEMCEVGGYAHHPRLRLPGVDREGMGPYVVTTSGTVSCQSAVQTVDMTVREPGSDATD